MTRSPFGRPRPARVPVLRRPSRVVPSPCRWRLSWAAAALCSGAALAQTPPQQEVLVQATRFPQPRAELPFGVSVLTAEDLRTSGVSTVGEAVAKLLGVPGRQDFYGGGELALDLRGFGGSADSNQVIVLDGVRLSEADTGGTRLAGIPIDTVERIEVLRGNAAVLYGEGATAGAIVITTRLGTGGGVPRSSLYGAVGRFGLRELRASGSVQRGPWTGDLALQKREADNHRDNFRSDSEGVGLGLRWQDRGIAFGGRLAADDLKTGLPGALTDVEAAIDPRQTTHPTDRARIRNERASLFGQALLAGWQVAADLAWRQKALRSVTSSPFGFSAYDYDVQARQQSLRARRALDLGGLRHEVSAGIDRQDWTRSVLGAFGSTAEQRSVGLYVRDEVALPTGTRVAAGVRRERLDKDATVAALDARLTAWDLGLTQSLGGDWAAYGRTGRSFRVANADEFTFTAPGVTLRPQVSRDHELGLRWTTVPTRLEVRAYRSALRDEIGFDPAAANPFGGLGANANFDPTRRQGLELEARHRVNAQWQVGLVAARRQARFVEGPYAGRDVPLAPRSTVSLRADWRPAGDQRVDAVLRHVGPSHPDLGNQCRLAGYTTLDLRYAKTWGALEAALALFNLTDRRYVTQAFACNGAVPTSLYPEPGRSATASLRWWF
jgi:iron complex outermembrane receptor protein